MLLRSFSLSLLFLFSFIGSVSPHIGMDLSLFLLLATLGALSTWVHPCLFSSEHLISVVLFLISSLQFYFPFLLGPLLSISLSFSFSFVTALSFPAFQGQVAIWSCSWLVNSSTVCVSIFTPSIVPFILNVLFFTPHVVTWFSPMTSCACLVLHVCSFFF